MTQATHTATRVDLSGDRRRRRRESIVRGLFLAAGLLSIAISAAII